MHIRIEPDASRSMSWTDKKNGYLCLEASGVDTRFSGYWRGDKKYLSDFFIPIQGLEADIYRTNAVYTDVKPEGFSSIFRTASGELTLDVSLLMGDQAFYVKLSDGRTLDGPGENTAGIGLVLPAKAADSDVLMGTELERGKGGMLNPEAEIGTELWHRYERDGLTCWQNDSGIAIVSAVPFKIDMPEPSKICIFPEADSFDSIFWYVAFEEDGESARKKVIQLANTNAIALHRAKVAEFLECCTVDAGHARFNDAVAWAQFSGWMLVTDDPEKGIWAGLPWFRDNWGRDTFIALSGILLVSGRFSDARSILTGFARLQDLDPSSRDFGLIPNRYRCEGDILYNSADGTLWFIRALWEYVQYSGDLAILDELAETVDRALDADCKLRTDEHGFLKHDDADTWMDARTKKGIPYSPRGDRACEIQALWYTALSIGSSIARIRGKERLSAERDSFALRVREAFNRFFWCDERNALADRLPPGPHGEWLRDFRVRPNQVLAVSVPSILDPAAAWFLDSGREKAVLGNVSRELVSPFGLFSLSPDDPLFHPRHENPEWHHKDAAYHNGTIWLWNTGPFITASTLSGDAAASGSSGASRDVRDVSRSALSPILSQPSSALLFNEAAMILDAGCAGTLSENIHAEPDEEGRPVLSGTWSQAWSVSEFARNVHQDILGFNPRLAENRIDFRPHVPVGLDHWIAEPEFGPGWKMRIELNLRRATNTLLGTLVWKNGSASFSGRFPSLSVNGMRLEPGVPLELSFSLGDMTGSRPDRHVPSFLASGDADSSARETGARYWTGIFPERDFATDWCGSIRQKNYLEKLVSRGISSSFALEFFFDSDYFRRKYHCAQALGAIHSSAHTVFRLWAPTARAVSLVLYPDGNDSEAIAELSMQHGFSFTENAGVWEVAMNGDLHGVYYRYRVRVHGIVREIADPSARACGVNGKRSMVVDFSRTNPPGWNQVRPVKVASPNDVVAYEVHVADISSSPFWNGDSRVARTYAGAALRGTSFRGKPTGFDHIRSLGVTHVQFMPIFDFGSVDENRLHDASYENRFIGGKFNWGYDPENYSVPEGSYSTDPRDGLVRIRELKGLIRDFLANGIGVIMDVVYNHVPAAQNHSLGIAVPGYYFRTENFSGAGDDTASEREMFRRYMISSLSWWLAEYKLSGFRFDLMGLHDVETMNAIASALRKIRSDVILYGEGWDMYRAGKMIPASMLQARKLPDFGFFNDAIRCGIKGPAFIPHEGGFIHDGSHLESVKFGIVGAVYHHQIHNRHVDGTANPNPWSDRTAASVNYTEIHDNSTLYDKLVLVEPGKSEAYYERLQKMAIGIVLLSQGMPILHAGMEFMRTKEIPASLLAANPGLGDLYRTADGQRAFSHNTYNLGDGINGLDWMRCAEKQSIVAYVRNLIAVRRNHPLFRLQSAPEVVLSVSFFELCPQILCWVIDGCTTVDTWSSACIVVNTSSVPIQVQLPDCANGGLWHLVTDGEQFMEETALKEVDGGKADSVGTAIAAKALYLYAEF